jgi:hypothetical protein
MIMCDYGFELGVYAMRRFDSNPFDLDLFVRRIWCLATWKQIPGR